MYLHWILIKLFLQLLLTSLIAARLNRDEVENHLLINSGPLLTIKSSLVSTVMENFSIGILSSHFSESYEERINSKIKEMVERRRNVIFFRHFHLNIVSFDIDWDSSVMDILNMFCHADITKELAAAIIDYELLNAFPFMVSFFMYLASIFKVPVLTTQFEGFGLQSKSLKYTTSMMPKLSYRSSALLSILKKYSWHHFSIVTTDYVGNYQFIQAIRAEMLKMQDQFEMTLEKTIQLDIMNYETSRVKLTTLREANSRIFLFYCTKNEAESLIEIAKEIGLIGKSFMWVGDQTFHIWQVGSELHDQHTYSHIEIDCLAVDSGLRSYMYSSFDLMTTALEMLFDGVESSLIDASQNNHSTVPATVTCKSDEIGCKFGEIIMRSWDSLRFIPGTSFRVFGLKLEHFWENYGSWTPSNLQINRDIVWPEKSTNPPTGRPKCHLKVIFKEEPPFIFMGMFNPISGKCTDNEGVTCRMTYKTIDINNISETQQQNQCCIGFGIDLLKALSTDMEFDFDLIQIRDGNWGAEVNGHWNGLVAALINKEADIALTSFTVNSLRESVLDFSNTFLEARIAILVSKTSGTKSAKAFLEPFDVISWVMIFIVCIHAAAFAIFLLEWISPAGYNMTTKLKDITPSMLHSYWLVWADLFGASVSVNKPKSTSARFMTAIWALFALVCLGMYTANLTYFMTAADEYIQLSGITDDKLRNFNADITPLRYGTVPFGHTDMMLRNYHPNIHRYMEQFNQSNVEEGLRAVMIGKLDAFIYDATVLKYLVGQGENCLRLKVEGGNIMAGYGIGFPKHSKLLAEFNQHILMYKNNGFLDTLQQEWFSETCHPDKLQRGSSTPLSVDQFMGVFILLGLGMTVAILCFFIEHLYALYRKDDLSRTNTGKRSALVGLALQVGRQASTFNGKMHHDKNPLEQRMRVMRQNACKRRNLQSGSIRYAWHTED